MQYKNAVERSQRPWLISLLLVAVGAGVYAGAFLGAFQYDDGFAILLNSHLGRIDIFAAHLDHMVRPVLQASFLLDRSLYGQKAAGYHLLNVLLHLGSGLLVYRILRRAVTRENRHIPFWAALLFLIHPIETEAVTYISGRASELMAFFYLLAFLLYVKGSDQTGQRVAGWLLIPGAMAFLLLSLGSKETAMTFPLALLLWDGLVRQLNGAALRTRFFSAHLPFWLVVLTAALWAWRHPRYSALAQFSLEIRPLWDNLLSELHAVTYALGLFCFPWKQNFDHDLPTMHSVFQWPLPLDLVTLGGLAALGLMMARRVPLFSFGLSWFFVHLLPTSLIPRADLLSERNLYLASIGLILAVVVVVVLLLQKLTVAVPYPGADRVAGYSLAVSAVLVLGLLTYQRNLLYRDAVSLWSDTVRKSPAKARPHNNLGHAYAMRGDWERAIEEFRVAVSLDPDYALAKKNLRDAYLHEVGRD